jgi:transposase
MDGHKGPLIVLEYLGGKGGGMNSSCYREQVLEGALPAFYQEIKEKRGRIMFQQDGAPSHTSKLTQQWFSQYDIPLIFHPASLPDLNPIEPVWHELKSRLRSLEHPLTTAEGLKSAIHAAWDSMPIEDVNKHAHKMSEHVEAILRAKGGHTHF